MRPTAHLTEVEMAMLWEATLYGSILVASTVGLHAWGTIQWLIIFNSFYFKKTKLTPGNNIAILMTTTLFFVFLHLVEILLWAAAYYIIPEIERIMFWPDAIYFSMVTFTTLGYGDIVLAGDTRMLTGIQSINGIILCGWSTALLFLVVQIMWKQELKSPMTDQEVDEQNQY